MPSPDEAPSPSTPATTTTDETPISQLLNTLGITREDLERHTAQMRQFLASENARKIARAQASGELVRGGRVMSSEEVLDLIKRATGLQEESQKPSMPLLTRSSHLETTPSPTAATVPSHSRSASRVSKSRSRYDEESEQSSGRSNAQRARRSTRERHRSRTAKSPSSRPKISLDEVMQMRSNQARRVSSSDESEESGDESLRDVFTKHQAGVSTPRYRYPHPAKTTQVSGDGGKRHYRDYSPAPSRGGNYYRDDDSQTPVTPQTVQTAQTPTRNPHSKTMSYYRHSYASRSQVLSSSPPLSSPVSSPVRYSYNLVSSPGPMSDPPDQFDPDLPYTLPPGPYMEEKPDFSYAALIGQAIMASPQHGLRLKDIYDYISIVYPFYKRNGHSHSQKWMNAIRQNLTNTPQFFKKEHPSGKASKGALWCIADKDFPCFADGGYNRHALNPDSAQSQKAEKRKRKKEEKLKEEKAKKARFAASVVHPSYAYPYGIPQLPRPQFAGKSIQEQVQLDIIFPPLPANHPNAHLVNTATTSRESLDEDVLFPPLPAYSQTRIAQEQRMKELSSQSSSSSLAGAESRTSPEPGSDDVPSSPVLAPPLSSETSTSSVPALTPNNSSSSPREAEADVDDEDDFSYFSEYIESETQSLHDEPDHTEEEAPVTKEDKGKAKANEAFMFTSLPPSPTSPTVSRRATQATRSPSTSLYAGTGFLGYSVNRSSTPPNDLSVYLGGSHTLTPLARRNPPSTPTRKRKTSSSADDNLLGSDERPDFLKAIPKTPSRRTDDATAGAGASNAPVTPRRIFSPFAGFSPFRTPSRRSIFDAADPSRILDDELEALSAAKQRAADSPIGLFPRGKGLLYESPSLPSPGKWRPW